MLQVVSLHFLETFYPRPIRCDEIISSFVFSMIAAHLEYFDGQDL